MTIKAIFWDIGGVLLTNGWDREQRARVLARFGIDEAAFNARHHLISPELEAGRLGLDEYLSQTAFARGASPCTREAFLSAMRAESQPHEGTLALAREVAGEARMYSLNNESRELNEHRIEAFHLDEFLLGFFSSCYLGVTKPNPRIYRTGLDLARVRPDEAVMIDDRAQNADAARGVGMHAIQHVSAEETRAALAALGVRA